MKYILVIIFILSSDLHAQTIYKCTLENGTLSYQKEPCIADDSTILDNIHKPNATKSREEQLKDFEDVLAKSVENVLIELKPYEITMLVLKNWEITNIPINKNMYHLKLRDYSKGLKLSILIDIILPKIDKPLSKDQLKNIIKKIGNKMVSGSVQKTVKINTMNVTDGIGYNTAFTDANLVNKSTYPAGEYLHTLKGVIYKQGVIINFTILTNNFDNLNYTLALQFIESGIKIKE